MVTFEELNDKTPSSAHLQLLTHVKDMIRLSRIHMHKKYGDWDRYDETYRGIRMPDEEDKKAKDKREPVKMVVPLGYAQLQTFVAFGMTLYTQNENFYELIGMSPEDFVAADMGEATLQRDLDHNTFDAKLYQWLLDIGRYGLGVMKCHWVEETQMIDQDIPPKTFSFLGLPITLRSAKTEPQKVIKYQGNLIQSVIPFRFFPDPRLPIGRFQEGEFCASEEEYTFADLKQLESEGVVAGIDHIPQFKDITEQRRVSRLGFVDPMKQANVPIKTDMKPAIVVTEDVVKLVPKQFKLDGKPIGKEDYPVKYLIWYANDARIIRCEPFNYIHNEFPYVAGEMSPDIAHFLNAGIMEGIEELQDSVSWFINSHIRSVRRTISNQLVVDPAGINMDDLKNHRPVIRLQPDASRSGVDRWVKQLDVHDVTQGHVADALQLKQLIEVVTGINDNLLGQFHGGRRSATEARQVTASAGSRLKTTFSLLFKTGLIPLGRQMLSNLRDGLTVETYVRMFGSAANGSTFQQFKQISRDQLVGDYDFGVFDGTTPSEKGYQADVLTELVTVLLGNPMVIQMTGLDPRALIFEILKLKGIKYPERFAIQNNPLQTAQTLQQTQMMNGQQNGNGQAGTNANGGPTAPPQRMGGAPGNGLLDGLGIGGNGAMQ